jgi:hypothetical protein
MEQRYGILSDDLPNESNVVVDVEEMELIGNRWKRTVSKFKLAAPNYVDDHGNVMSFTIPKGSFVCCELIGREIYIPLSWPVPVEG